MFITRLGFGAGRRASFAAACALVAAAVAAPSAGAAAQTVGLQCDFPPRGTDSVDLQVDVSAPATWPTKQTTPAFPVAATFTLPAAATEGLKLVSVASVEGTWDAVAAVTFPGGFDLEVEIPLVIPRTDLPADGALELEATGGFPPMSFPQVGDVTLQYTDTTASLTFRNSAGTILRLAEGYPDVLGGNPEVFEVQCPVVSGPEPFVFTTAFLGEPGPPTVPGKPVVSKVTDSSAEVCWAPSITPDGDPLSYDVFLGSTKKAVTTGTCATLTGLAPDQSYSVTVIASDGTLTSAASAATTFTTLVREEPAPVKYGYGVSGAAQLKNLTRGTVPLAGSVAAELTLATGDFTADLSLRRSTASLVALGFLPVVAKVDVVPTVPVTGNLAGGVLTAATKVRIKLPQVTLFGLQLAGGSNCQTRSASAINLKSVGEFDALDGGTLAGTFAISDLTGCGALTGLVSPLTAGPGNTIALKLAPAAA